MNDIKLMMLSRCIRLVFDHVGVRCIEIVLKRLTFDTYFYITYSLTNETLPKEKRNLLENLNFMFISIKNKERMKEEIMQVLFARGHI